MAKKTTGVLIVDKKESLPMRVNHSTRQWEIFDPATNSYKPTGLSAVPEDDATAMKYYKLSNTPVAPVAPGDSSTSWPDVASLNTAVITNGGWSADPLQVSLSNRFCWAAYYKLENVYDTTTDTYSQRYTLNMTGLYNNYAPSPTITISADGTVTITNADGTTQTQKLMTADSYNSLMTMVQSLQSQVDSAVYSYSGAGVPTKDHSKAPLNSWGIEAGSPSTVIADIYEAHVGDTYTNTDDYVSYRWVLKEGMSASDPLSYEWQTIADGALSAALAEIAALGNKTVKIFTAQPTVPYKKGDMWIEGTTIKTCITGKDENGTFAATDWIVPFATKEEVEVIRQGLATARTDLDAAMGNITDLQGAMDTLETETLAAMQDNIISENERGNLKTFSDQLDVEQEQLLSNVAYLKASPYLPAAQKTSLENAANKLLTATTGTLDILQAKIAAILNPSGDQGLIISTAERQAYDSALAAYKVDHKALSVAIDNARTAVDAELKRLADEKVDGMQISEHNLFLNGRRKSDFAGSTYVDDPVYGQVSKISGTYVQYWNNWLSTNLKAGTKVSISVMAKGSSTTESFRHYLNIENGYINFDSGLTTEWKLFKVTRTLNSDLVANPSNTIFHLNYQNANYIDVYIAWIAVVVGDKPMLIFNEAPEDYNTLISAVDVEYGLSDSATVAPTTWATTSPQWTAGKYVWQRVKTTLKDDTVNYSNTACIQGASGKGISSVQEQYYQSTSYTSLAGGSWVNTAPAPNPDKYIWTRSIITYTDSTTTTTDATPATGMKGTDALIVTISTQGYFRNYWERQTDGSYLLKKEVVGGVLNNGTEYVQCTAMIRKGVRDVTDTAIANGAALEWHINGTQKFGNVKTIQLDTAYADGNDDNIALYYDDTNASNW